jgi:L-alanine-DL-glutamate epimerase-like enolase superfamily enzyme
MEAYKMNFKLDEPIRISFHSFTHRENILLKLTRNDLIGYGEAAPFKLITEDTQAEVFEYLRKNKGLVEKELEISEIHEKLPCDSQTSRAAIDFALHDLIGKKQGIPAHKLYSDKFNKVLNSITIFIKDLESTRLEAQRILGAYPDLKIIKIKLSGDEDIERANTIKSCTPSGISFMLDANQAFDDPNNAVTVLNQVCDILGDVILIEEPCPKGDLEKLKHVKENLSVPIIADETCVDINDLRKIIEKDAADGINIKLQKAGGIYPGRLMAELAADHGLKVMVGSMLEGPISIAAGVHFAVCTPNVFVTDLDMDLDLPKHWNYRADFREGSRVPANQPGLGVELDFNTIEKLKKEGRLEFERII